MKRCPQCQSTYTDDALQYCLQDGAKLAIDFSQAETLITHAQAADKTLQPPAKEQILISISEMLQLLLELDYTANVLEWYQGTIRWFRINDKSEIDNIEANTIKTLEKLGLLKGDARVFTDGTHRTCYSLTSKAERIIKARNSRSPIHKTPYLGEKFWLVVHNHRKGVEVYPYLGAAPPDLAMLVEPSWKAKEYTDSFSVSCYPLDTLIPQDELLKK
ncbi:MAG TPA: hypothetical protein VF735_15075 [Pyrinomonadaceae bacterium]|jgi:hypothetical protein